MEWLLACLALFVPRPSLDHLAEGVRAGVLFVRVHSERADAEKLLGQVSLAFGHGSPSDGLYDLYLHRHGFFEDLYGRLASGEESFLPTLPLPAARLWVEILEGRIKRHCIKKGMTPKEVTEVLGSPSIGFGSFRDYWVYDHLGVEVVFDGGLVCDINLLEQNQDDGPNWLGLAGRLAGQRLFP
jgi:hypothetical protein